MLESPEKASGTPSNYTQEMDGDSLIHSCRSILSALLRQGPDTLHQSLGVDEYLALQLPSTVGAESEILDPFFSELSDEFCKTASPTWVLPPFGNDFVDFLRTGHLHQVKPVVDYIIHALEPFTDFTVFNPQSDQQRALPLIWFSAHLFLASPLAHDQLLEYGFLDVVERIWFHTVATTAIDDQSTTALQVACCIAIGAFSAMQDHYPDLAHHLRTERTNFFLSIFTHYISNHRAISSVCSVRCRSFPSAKEDRQQFYKELVRLATYDSSLSAVLYHLLPVPHFILEK